jgi:hypothetical protein
LTDAQRLNVSSLRVLSLHVDTYVMAFYPFMVSIILHAARSLRTLEVHFRPPTHISTHIQQTFAHELTSMAFAPTTQYPHLQHLELSGFGVLGTAFTNALATRMPVLKRLNLVGTWAHQTTLLEDVLTTQGNLPLLRELALDNTPECYSVQFMEHVWSSSRVEKLMVVHLSDAMLVNVLACDWPPETFSVEFKRLLRVRYGVVERRL